MFANPVPLTSPKHYPIGVGGMHCILFMVFAELWEKNGASECILFVSGHILLSERTSGGPLLANDR